MTVMQESTTQPSDRRAVVLNDPALKGAASVRRGLSRRPPASDVLRGVLLVSAFLALGVAGGRILGQLVTSEMAAPGEGLWLDRDSVVLAATESPFDPVNEPGRTPLPNPDQLSTPTTIPATVQPTTPPARTPNASLIREPVGGADAPAAAQGGPGREEPADRDPAPSRPGNAAVERPSAAEASGAGARPTPTRPAPTAEDSDDDRDEDEVEPDEVEQEEPDEVEQEEPEEEGQEEVEQEEPHEVEQEEPEEEEQEEPEEEERDEPEVVEQEEPEEVEQEEPEDEERDEPEDADDSDDGDDGEQSNQT